MQADGMKSKKLVIILLSILFSLNSFSSLDYNNNCRGDDVLPKFYVDDDYNSSTPGWQVDHFDSIQDAIDESSLGDRIVVYAGYYTETITIQHKLDLFGEDKEITIIDGNSSGSVITISAQQVNIGHLTIKESGNNSDDALIKINAGTGSATITDNILTSGKNAIIINSCDNNIIYDNTINDNTGNGLWLNNSDSNQITYNTFTENSNGLFLYSSWDNTIRYNSQIKDNRLNGIFLNETSDLNYIQNNNISENTQNGIFLNDNCNINNISYNDIFSNADSGIRIENSSDNTLYLNTVNSNTNYGIMIVGSNNLIVYNTINSNKEHGLFLFADDNSFAYLNTIVGNTKDGIHLLNSTSDNISSNYIKTNSRYGIYLDYFTMSNLVYNNYLYYNTYNGMDKSLSRNRWNITTTSGTNIVGGGNVSGNYWTDYDETSEGATDANNNGIADLAHTIYAGNKDNGALLDVTPPTVGTPQVTPSNQTIGGYTYISITVTDNVEIKNVYLNVVNPNSQTTNFSITQNKTGNTYYCNKQFSPVGQYSFYITAKDPRNWANSTSKTFYIREGTPPTITDNTVTTGYPAESFRFNATVKDDQDDSSELTVKVNWSHASNSGNTTLKNVDGDFFGTSVILDSSTSSLSYYFYAEDQWGNSRVTDTKTVTIVDEIPPEIAINKHEYSSDGVIHTYNVSTTITDKTQVVNATIEYWYAGSSHQTADMDKSGNKYEKIIYLDEIKDVYCIVRAEDPSGNQNDTKKPFPDAGGPYSGVIGLDINFNGSGSFDLDGNITLYSWSFGDGTNGTGEVVQHSYSTNGRYNVELTVTDDEGNTSTDTTYATIIRSTKVETSTTILDQIQELYEINLSKLFYAYDIDGDDIADTFVDPNNKLKNVKQGHLNISGNIVFLLSTNDDYLPEFFWNSTTDKIIAIKNEQKDDVDAQEINDIAVANVEINKTTGWICLNIKDEYPHATLTVKANNSEIQSDRIWRKDNRIYVLDDPVITYQFTYTGIIIPDVLEYIEFYPSEHSTIGQENPTITIKCNIKVIIDYADFYNRDTGDILIITDMLKTSDYKTFTYTPSNTLPTGEYEIFINITDEKGEEFKNSTIYNFVSYEIKEESLLSINNLMMLGGIIFIVVAIFILSKKLHITFESFIYFRDKKIIPFVKPIVFGPLKIDVNDENIRKAEFYLNGELKDTLTQAPYTWQFNEPSIMRQKIETKVYDQDGNSNSSGEMTFYVFNPRFFK